tara:strand:+ start:778 stop:1062 length:285 start_codon:yes stop_codon:yes gene_type:complete
MSIVKYLESLEYGEGDGGLDVVEYKGRVCMMEYDNGGSLGNILEMKNGKWCEYEDEDLWNMEDEDENELEVDSSECVVLHTISDSKYDLEDELG